MSKFKPGDIISINGEYDILIVAIEEDEVDRRRQYKMTYLLNRYTWNEFVNVFDRYKKVKLNHILMLKKQFNEE